jgi:hypothetical protein
MFKLIKKMFAGLSYFFNFNRTIYYQPKTTSEAFEEDMENIKKDWENVITKK